jgi:hypothetical protein
MKFSETTPTCPNVMPAKAGIHALPAAPRATGWRIARKQELLFLKKKKQKNFHFPRDLAPTSPAPPGEKVFCFPRREAFFSNKKRFPS